MTAFGPKSEMDVAPVQGCGSGSHCLQADRGIGLHTVCKGIGGSGLQTPDVTTAGSGQQLP
jgi:hypothetical protein